MSETQFEPAPSTVPGVCHLGHTTALRSEVGAKGTVVLVEFCPVCEGNGTVETGDGVPQ